MTRGFLESFNMGVVAVVVVDIVDLHFPEQLGLVPACSVIYFHKLGTAYFSEGNISSK